MIPPVVSDIDDLLRRLTDDGTPEVRVGRFVDEEPAISFPVFANDVVFDLGAQTATFTVSG